MTTGLDRETRSIVGQTLRRFVRDCADVHRRRERLAETPVDERTHWATMAELGILAVPFGEPFGGVSGAAADVADAARALGEGLVLEPFVEAAVIAGGLLAARGAEDAEGSAAVAAVIAGSVLPVLVDGRNGLLCERRDGGFRLSGRASVVPAATAADQWLVAAHGADGTPALFRIPAGGCGAAVAAYRLMDGRGAADVSFADAAVPDEALWLEGGAAVLALDQAALRAVAAYAADAVGVMERLLTDTGGYLMTRKQFGAVIGSFQALQHRYADMHMAWLEARAIARALAAGIDSGGSDEGGAQRRLAAAAASVVERAAARIGHEAIQMHGGMGATEELAVSHLNARLVVLTRLIRAWVPRGAFLGDDRDV